LLNSTRQSTLFSMLMEKENFHALSRKTLTLSGDLFFIDNIYGAISLVDLKHGVGRERSIGLHSGTFQRPRALVYALLNALDLHPILPFNEIDQHIQGIGLSDVHFVATQLAQYFNYTNTFLHKEPILDITEKIPKFTELDFILSSDVFEHIPPPVERAFEACYAMLKPGGVCVLTVPYNPGDGQTIEHFPSLHKWKIKNSRTGPYIRNQNRNGEIEIFENLVFHGGDGLTLEMRVFSERDLIRMAKEAGFREVTVLREAFPLIGIFPEDFDPKVPMGMPLIFRK